MQPPSNLAQAEARSGFLSYFSLFTSLGTLLCCALPSLLVLLGLGASVASTLSVMPWLVTLSRHKAWVFAFSGILILLSTVASYWIAPRLKAAGEGCITDPACARASRISRVTLWVAVTIYLAGFFTAYFLGPILTRIDGG